MNPIQENNIVDDGSIKLRHALELYASLCPSAHEEEALPGPGNLLSGVCVVVPSLVKSIIVESQSCH